MTRTSAAAFEVVPGWGTGLPDLTAQDVSDIATSPVTDDVYLLYRDPTEVVVASPQGDVRARWGAGVLTARAHGVTVAASGHCYVVDEGAHRVREFDASGGLLREFGSGPSNPAFERPVTGDPIDHIPRPYPPFCRPTRLAVAASGDLYVSDGYGNCRVHRFAPDGKLLGSWGEPGTGPGEFHTPHDVFVDRRGRVLVSDRENDRVQVFDLDGTFLEAWTDLHRPQAVVEGPDGLYHVAEGAWRPGHVSRMHGAVAPSPSRVSVVEPDGRVVSRFGGEPGGLPGNFLAAHGIAVDSHGDVYVAEVCVSVLRKFPELAEGTPPVVQKLRRVDGG